MGLSGHVRENMEQGGYDVVISLEAQGARYTVIIGKQNAAVADGERTKTAKPQVLESLLGCDVTGQSIVNANIYELKGGSDSWIDELVKPSKENECLESAFACAAGRVMKPVPFRMGSSFALQTLEEDNTA